MTLEYKKSQFSAEIDVMPTYFRCSLACKVVEHEKLHRTQSISRWIDVFSVTS